MLYFIPTGVAFSKDFAKGLLKRTSDNPLDLAKYLILTSTKRAGLELNKVLSEESKNTFLPKILSFADLLNPDTLLSIGPDVSKVKYFSRIKRLGYLANLILQEKGFTPNAAFNMAVDLAELWDEAIINNIDLQKIKDLIPEAYAKHWEKNSQLMAVVVKRWPELLAKNQVMDPIQFEQFVFKSLGEFWREFPPNYPIIILGSSGTRPSTRILMQEVLKIGHVVLAGWDFEPENPTVTHPQYTLRELWKYLGKPEIEPWHSRKPSIYIRDLMQSTIKPNSQIPQHVKLLPCESPWDEVKIITMIAQYHLNNGEDDIVIVTPNLNLSQRLYYEFLNQDIYPNLSQGIGFKNTVVGTFLRLCSKIAAQHKVLDILAIFEHPLCQKTNRAKHLQQVRNWELSLRTENTSCNPDAMASLHFLRNLNPFTPLRVSSILDLHFKMLEALAGTELWQHEDGQKGFELMQSLYKECHDFPQIYPREYPALFNQLVENSNVHAVESIGSKVSILGTLEARMIQSKTMILAGLNEGSWPKRPSNGPWLNQSMAQSLGLPHVDRRIGLAAHDFISALGASNIYITRCVRQEGVETIASRWWQRISTLGANIDNSWQKLLHAVEEQCNSSPINHTLANPPKEVRPKVFSVTSIARLMRDPYGIYAKDILRLKPLRSLDKSLSLRDFGNLMHGALDEFCKKNLDPKDPNSQTYILNYIEEKIKLLSFDARVYSFWWPRLQRLTKWVLQTWSQRPTVNAWSEIEGVLQLEEFQITAKADRIELHEDGLRIIDFKTGTPPTQKSVLAGIEPQLTLEGLLANLGGFSIPGNVASLEYWHLSGGTPPGKIIKFNKAQEIIKETRLGVCNLLQWQQVNPYYICPNPNLSPRYNDYAHLERL